MGKTERVEGVQSLISGSCRDYVPVLCEGLSKDHPVLFLTVGFGLIGFLDDYLKVVMKRSDGLFPMQKMALKIVVTAILRFTS